MKNSYLLGLLGLGAVGYFFLKGTKPAVTQDTAGSFSGNTPASKWQNPPQSPEVSAVTTKRNNSTATFINVPTVSGFVPTGTLNAGSMGDTQVTQLVKSLQSVATQQAKGIDNATIINQALSNTAKTFIPYIPSNVSVKTVPKEQSIAYKKGYIK